jgi:phospholipid/cholesterol/gamma-HCH transport system substrate-binding protein
VKELRATVLVGLLAIVSVALVVFGVLNTQHGPGDDAHTYIVSAIFDDATGVAKGTRVTIAGIPIGQVEGVKLEGERVRVSIKLKNEVVLHGGRKAKDGALQNAAMVTRLQASLLGDYYLELTPGHAGQVLSEGDTIPIVVTTTAIDATLERIETAATILPKIDKIAGDIAKITDNAAKVFGGKDGGDKFTKLSDNLVATSKNLANTSDLVRRRLETGPLSAGGDLDETVKSLNLFAQQATELGRQATTLLGRAGGTAVRSLDHFERVAETVSKVVGTNAKDVDSTIGNVAVTLKKLQETLNRVDVVVANLEIMTEKTKNGEGTIGQLLTNDKIAKDAEVMVAGARQLLGRFTGGDTGIDFRTVFYGGFDDADPASSRWRTMLNFKISPNKEKYYLLGISSDIRRTPGQTTTTTRLSGTDQPVLQETVLTNMDDIKFGFQYVRRFGFIAVRGGLIESRAGVGVDLFALNDRIEIGADVFRFTDDAITDAVPVGLRPRFRGRVMWHFLPFAYAQVGGDELLNSDRRDVFFGLGIHFTDNDLIMLFATAPTVRFN